jgi:CHRD domain/Secretion system C-terminal sorting domain
MKKVYSFLLSFSLILLFNFQAAANKDGTILLTAQLTGSQEAPTKVTTKAKGLVTIILEQDRTLTINGVFDSLSGAVTNCHFHTGKFGEAGGVTINLISYVKGNRIYGKLTPTKTFLSQLMKDSIYINVHTAANSGGEIRGQVYQQSDYHFWALMGGAFEVPATTSTGLGLSSFVLSLSQSKMEYKIVVTGLTGAITSAHIHKGSSLESGPVVQTLAINGNVLSGTLTNITAGFTDSLFQGLLYVNVHTAANPNGEIRGQIYYVSGVFGFDALLDGASEVPAVTTSAKGLAVAWATETLDSLQYAVIYTGITPSAAHFHGGTATQTGSVIYPLVAYNRAPTAAYLGKVALTNDFLGKMLKDSIYVNIHSTANPNGEIRGQISTSLHEGTVADMCGKQEVPVVTTAAIGAGFVSTERAKSIGYLSVVTNGLSGNATAAHIHNSPKGVAGGVYLNMGTTTNNSYSGAFINSRASAVDSITNGLMYFNVHTSLNGNGEVRGQLGKALTPDCLPTGIFELNGEKLLAKVYPNPAQDALNLVFASNQSFDAQVVISDLIGRSVSVNNIKVVEGENQLPLSVSNLSNGLYFIQLKNNGKIVFSEKIVKE